MAYRFYRCDPELFKECPKTSCQKECILTTHKEYALKDEFGRPIVGNCENKDLKHDFIEKMRAEITKLQTYKMFPYEATVYVERDEVMKIFEKYTVGGEENADSN